MTFQTPGMRRKERELEGKMARPVTIATVFVKARLAGHGTSDGRDGSLPYVVAAIDGVGQVIAHLTQQKDHVAADVQRPGQNAVRVKIRTIPQLQEFIKGLGATEPPRGGSTPKKEGSRR